MENNHAYIRAETKAKSTVSGGNQVFQKQMPRAGHEGVEANSGAAVITGFGHDFRQIPAHTSESVNAATPAEVSNLANFEPWARPGLSFSLAEKKASQQTVEGTP